MTHRAAQHAVLVYAPGAPPLPETIRLWVAGEELDALPVATPAELLARSRAGLPRLIVLDASVDEVAALGACRALKSDCYTGIVPTAVWVLGGDETMTPAFAAGADEVLQPRMSAIEMRARLAVLLRRADRDTYVHPSTRLPGALAIETEIRARIAAGLKFAVCYADLDHFKEFNDRYSYNSGDRVIRLVANVLHDVVGGLAGPDGFVGHIGGDDFIFIVPLPWVAEVCGEVVSVFDELAPQQYSEQDRRAGYFFGKDRRGQLHRVPLMTLSIGVVTNERRSFTTAAQVSELATEMKSYAKTLTGSVFTVDRRQDGEGLDLERSGEGA
jgi:diguanylate cyclase (GGDEF)-like protein